MDQPPRVALVTGAGQGIGRAIALTLARDGYQVVVNDLPSEDGSNQASASKTIELIREAGQEAYALAADVGSRADVEQLFATIAHRSGRLDVAVANAAYNVKRKIVDTDWPTAQRIVDVTLWGTYHIGQLAAKQMIAQASEDAADAAANASILFIGSVHAELAVPFHGVYAMAKAASNRLCQTLAAELVPHRIRVNAINPGWIDTPGERAYLSEQQLQEAAQKLPWGRLGTPDEIARLAAFLVSPAASYITGSIHSVDGGLRLANSLLDSGLEKRASDTAS